MTDARNDNRPSPDYLSAAAELLFVESTCCCSTDDYCDIIPILNSGCYGFLLLVQPQTRQPNCLGLRDKYRPISIEARKLEKSRTSPVHCHRSAGPRPRRPAPGVRVVGALGLVLLLLPRDRSPVDSIGSTSSSPSMQMLIVVLAISYLRPPHSGRDRPSPTSPPSHRPLRLNDISRGQVESGCGVREFESAV